MYCVRCGKLMHGPVCEHCGFKTHDKQIYGYVMSIAKHNGFPEMFFEVKIRIPVKLPARPKPPNVLSRQAIEVANKIIAGRTISLTAYQFDDSERKALFDYIGQLESWQRNVARACDLPDLHIGPVAIVQLDEELEGDNSVDRNRSGKTDN